jgi:hypothetical protein
MFTVGVFCPVRIVEAPGALQMYCIPCGGLFAFNVYDSVEKSQNVEDPVSPPKEN